MRILVVEDDPGVAAAVVDALRTLGHGVLRAGTAAEVPQLRAEVDLVLLDLGLPDADGFDVLRELRRASDMPVIVLTARGAERDVVRGLRLGADDYLVKPVRLRELLARVDAVARRAAVRGVERDVVEAGGLRVDLAARRVSVDGAEVALTAKEFEILAVLARRHGVAVGRDQVLDEVWGPSAQSMSRSLDVHLTSLRGKLARPGLISTVRGFGYRLGS